jgi:hypothetical protein
LGHPPAGGLGAGIVGGPLGLILFGADGQPEKGAEQGSLALVSRQSVADDGQGR